MLLEEFDHDQSAVIEPWFVHQPVEGFPGDGSIHLSSYAFSKNC